MEFYQTAYRFLKRSGLCISKGFIQNRMQSHPDYPSLVSLTDTLEEMCIEFTAISVNKDHLHELSYPLLAHLNTKEYDTFIHVSKPETFLQHRFIDQLEWNCLCIKKTVICSTEHEEWIARERRSTKILAWSMALLFVFLIGGTTFQSRPLLSLLQGLNLTGVALCSLIVAYNLGKTNIVTEELCGTNKDKECDKVLHSKKAKWKGVGLEDAGLTYFIGLSLFVFALSINNVDFISGLNLLTLISGMACIISIVSIIYQWKIIKSWCKMCLMVSGIIWLQALIIYLLHTTITSDFIFSLYQMCVFVASLLLPILLWINIKPLLQKVNVYIQKEIIGIKFKRNPDVFLSLLHNQRKVNNVIWDHEILLGNPTAPIQILIASNPFCAPCAKAHKQLELLIQQYPKKICICTRFTVDRSKKNDLKIAAVTSILKSYIYENKNAVERWFSQLNVKEFNHQLLSNTADDFLINQILQRHEDWTKSVIITHTPTIFLNGFELPKQYSITDLNSMLELILENITPFSVVANTDK